MDVRTDVMMSIIFIELYNMNGIHYYENNEVPCVLENEVPVRNHHRSAGTLKVSFFFLCLY